MEWKEFRKTYFSAITPVDEMHINIVRDIIIRRNELEWSQRELAEKSGVPQSTVNRIETLTSIPRSETLFKVCYALGLAIIAVPAEEVEED